MSTIELDQGAVEHRGVVIVTEYHPASYGYRALAGGRSYMAWGRSPSSALETAKLLVDATHNDPYSIDGSLWRNDTIHWRAQITAALRARKEG
jgi:hypothetical protein